MKNILKLSSLQKFNVLLCLALMLGTHSEGFSANFAKVLYAGDAVIWEFAELPENTSGVIVRVLYTPKNSEEDSFVEYWEFGLGQSIIYPFYASGLSKHLEDGTYKWDFQLVRESKVPLGYVPGLKREEGPIDHNGRMVELVGYTPIVKGREIIPNRGKFSVQSGSFVVIDGKIPEFEVIEDEKKQ